MSKKIFLKDKKCKNKKYKRDLWITSVRKLPLIIMKKQSIMTAKEQPILSFIIQSNLYYNFYRAGEF